MNPGTHIQTPDGLKYYWYINSLYERNKKDGMLEFFNDLVVKEIQRSDDEIERFIEDNDANRDYKMNDEDDAGWNWWKIEADCNSALRFFLKRGRYEASHG